jgi:arginine/ornithine N-succinyltransferase beta subunit
MNDYKLDLIAQSYAEDIFAEMKQYQMDEDDAREIIWEWVDSSEYVIYYHKAHEICQNCDVSEGEAFAEDVGMPENVTYDSLAVQIAFGELVYRVTAAFDKLMEDYDEEEAETA